MLFLSGLFYIAVFDSKPYLDNIDERTNYIIADVAEIPEEREKTYKLVLIAKFTISNDSIIRTNGKLLAFINKDSLSSEIKTGDRLILVNKFQEITRSQNPFEFDYKRYLWNQGIRRQGFLRPDEWLRVDSMKGNPILLFAADLRQKLLQLYQDYGLSGDEFSVASALTLGYKAALDEDIKKSYSTSGAMHVLAVSGLHVGIIFFVINYMLLFLNRIKGGTVIRAVILLLCLWFYATLTGLSPSVMRAATMFSFIVIGSALKRPANIYNTLSASAFFLIILNPFILWAVGFQLSYLAVIGIVFFQPRIYRFLYIKNKLLDKVWALTSVSIGAQLGTFPLSLFYFNQFPGLFFVTNLFVIPLATLILYSGILLFVFSWFSPVASIISILLKWLVWLLNEGVKLIESIPISHISGIYIYSLQVPLFYLLIGLFTLFLLQKQAAYLKMSLIIVLILTGFWSYGEITATNSRQLIVFNMNNQLAVNYMAGRQNIIIVDETSPEIRKQIEYVAKGVWARFNMKPADYYSFSDHNFIIERDNFFGKGQFWSFGEKTLVIADASLLRNFRPAYPIDIDLLILTGRKFIPLENLTVLFKPKQIIISPSVPFWLSDRYKVELDALAMTYFDIRTQGANIQRIR